MTDPLLLRLGTAVASAETHPEARLAMIGTELDPMQPMQPMQRLEAPRARGGW